MAISPKKVDVCIIGSGAGGGVVAKELGEQGINVVVLEAGRRFDPLRDYTDTTRPDWELSDRESWKKFRIQALSKFTVENRLLGRPTEAHGVGGGTLAYFAYAVRMRPDDFRSYTVEGVGADWPITYEDLVPYYRKVELDLGVSGLAGDPWTPMVDPYPNPPFEYSYANKIIKRGFDKLGFRLWPAPMARLSRQFDGRPMCVQCGLCSRGCLSGAKSSVDVTYIRKAEATGRVVVRPQSIATRIRVDAKGIAKSVIYFDKNGVEHEQQADVIIVSGGPFQSPRLLLNSTSKEFPNGLANSNGLVGKYLTQHFGVSINAIFPDRIDSFRGFFGGAISQDFVKTASTNSFALGWRYDLNAGVQGPVEMVKYASSWGRNLKDYMRGNFGHVAGISTLGEQIPDKRNCVELDPEVKDDYGMPVPRITFEYRKNERLMLPVMERSVREIFDASGAAEILSTVPSKPGAASHSCGTCRRGIDESMQSVICWGSQV